MGWERGRETDGERERGRECADLCESSHFSNTSHCVSLCYSDQWQCGWIELSYIHRRYLCKFKTVKNRCEIHQNRWIHRLWTSAKSQVWNSQSVILGCEINPKLVNSHCVKCANSLLWTSHLCEFRIPLPSEFAECEKCANSPWIQARGAFGMHYLRFTYRK